jgi:hypothetical protein
VVLLFGDFKKVQTFYGDVSRITWEEVLQTSFHVTGKDLTLNEIGLRSLGLNRNGDITRVIVKKGVPQNPEIIELREALWNFKKDPTLTNLISVILEIADLKYYLVLLNRFVTVKHFEEAFKSELISRLEAEIQNACQFLTTWVSATIIDNVSKLKYQFRFSIEGKDNDQEHKIVQSYLVNWIR